ncbi:MAG: hypothetical protein LC808_00965 [Actinobacteria bacterium]|nr:hypothetical protein [Actinomycetota bacterium]
MRFMLVLGDLLGDRSRLDSRALPNHLVVMSMDSAILHAWSLYEFFTGGPSGDEGGGRQPASWRLFGADRQQSTEYDAWKETLHARLSRIRRIRPQSTAARTGVTLPADLNK